MSAHTSSPAPVEDPQSPSLSQSFYPWVRHQSWSLTAQISAAVAFLFYLAEIAYYSPYLGKNSEPLFAGSTFPVVIDILHIIVISGFIAMTIRLRDDNKRGAERVKLIYRRIFYGPAIESVRKKSAIKPSEEDSVKTSGRVQSDSAAGDAAEKEEDERNSKVSQNRLKKFKKSFLRFWIGMLSLYVILGCSHALSMYETTYSSEDSVQIKGKKLKDKSSEVKYLSEWIASLSQNSKEKKVEKSTWSKKKVKNNYATSISKHIIFPAISFVINTATMVPMFSCFLIMYCVSFKEKDDDAGDEESDESKIKRFQRYFRWGVTVFCLIYVAILVLILVFSPGAFVNDNDVLGRNFHAVFFALSGILNALILALLITRLDSKLLGLRSWLICILYSYAAIQPLFAVFEFESEVMSQIRTAVISLAFILKVYFFLIIMYAVQTGKMLNYFYCFPALDKLTEYSAKLSGGFSFTKVFHYSFWLNGLMSACRYVGRFVFGRFRFWILIVALITIVFAAILLYYQPLEILRVQDNPVLQIDNYSRKIWAGLVSVANIMLIVVIIICLYLDGRNYRTISEKLAREASAVPPTLTGHDMEIIEIMKNAKKIFDVERGAGTFKACIEQICRFNRTFIFFWLLTALLHTAMTVAHFTDAYRNEWLPESQTIARLVLAFFQFGFTVFNILVFFRCFLLLDSPPIVKEGDKETAKLDESSKNPKPGSKLMDKFCRFLLLDIPPTGEKKEDETSKLKQSLGYSNLVAVLLVGLAIFIFIAANAHNEEPDYQLGFITLLSGVTGTVGGLAIALVVARMCSRWFGLSVPVTCVLLLYAAIQPLSVFIQFAKLEEMTIAVLVAALGLKFAFFLAVRNCMKKGPLLNYFVCLPLLRDRVNMIIENHFEITLTPVERGKYKLNILKNGKLQFASIEEFSTKAKCDKFIKSFTEELKELQKRPESSSSTREMIKTNFRPNNNLGAFWLEWVEKRHSEDFVLLESVTLRSEEKVEELRQEAIDMIPYCRYNR